MPLSFPNESASAFLRARDFLAQHRTDYTTAVKEFRWPELAHFNWALDYFDTYADGNESAALEIVEEDGRQCSMSFAAMSARSNQAANFLRECGVRRGDCVLLMLGNEIALWETLLAAMKLGAVIIPATVPHGWTDITDHVDYLSVRPDPDRDAIGADGHAHDALKAMEAEFRLAGARADDDQLARLVRGHEQRNIQVFQQRRQVQGVLVLDFAQRRRRAGLADGSRFADFRHGFLVRPGKPSIANVPGTAVPCLEGHRTAKVEITGALLR